ncbi:MAG: hypothetical protein WC850_03240 [Candidatus Gracilibacteria bacterium]
MKKTSIYFFVALFLLYIPITNGACNYQSEIDKCVEANKNSGAKNIDDFVCVDTNPANVEKIAYQIIFDLKLKEIDGDIENFLKTLENNIQYYYGPNKSESFLDGINYINEVFSHKGLLRNKYNNFCIPGDDNSIVKSYMACIPGDDNSKEAQIQEASTYFGQSKCEQLVDTKLYIYKKVAYNLLQVNKLDFLKEFRIKQTKATREKYDNLVGNMYVNLDNIMRINKQREKVTKQCQTISTN